MGNCNGVVKNCSERFLKFPNYQQTQLFIIMQEDIDFYFDETTEAMGNAIERLKRELVKVRTGKASPSMLDELRVEYYGTPTPLRQVANVGTLDARTLTIQPWEKKMLDPIEKAIFAANLGFTPQNDGQIIRIVIPMLTQERRKSLAKKAKSLGEDAKVSIRNARQDLMKLLKQAVKDGYPEDAGKRSETKAQELTDKYAKKAEEMAKEKEKDIMTI